jgi:hypothetical protein
MDAAHRKGAGAVDRRNASFGCAAPSGQRQAIRRARRQRAYRNAAATNELARAEADAFTLGQELQQ